MTASRQPAYPTTLTATVTPEHLAHVLRRYAVIPRPLRFECCPVQEALSQTYPNCYVTTGLRASILNGVGYAHDDNANRIIHLFDFKLLTPDMLPLQITLTKEGTADAS